MTYKLSKPLRGARVRSTLVKIYGPQVGKDPSNTIWLTFLNGVMPELVLNGEEFETSHDANVLAYVGRHMLEALPN
jgi:hypothetical protein